MAYSSYNAGYKPVVSDYKIDPVAFALHGIISLYYVPPATS